MNKKSSKPLILCLLIILICSISCQTLDPVALTKFSSKPPEVSSISNGSATVSGQFMDVGDGINAYGHCWAITTLPTVENFKKENSGVPEKQTEFTSKLENLLPETQYYVRAYADLNGNIIYSKQMDFKTLKKKSIHITKPKTGDKWNISSTQLIEWTDDIDENVKITLFKNNAIKSELMPSTESDGIYEWTVPAAMELANDYAVKIESINDATIADTSDLFSIKDDPYITISKPNSTDTWIRTTQYEIKWTDNIAENVNIELYKAGVKNSDIALNVASTQSYLWTIPHALTAATDYNIKITSTTNTSITTQSDQFKIAEEPYISITAPASAAKWYKGQQFQIIWTDNITENVNIELYKAGAKNSDIQLNIPSNGSYTWIVPATLTAASDYTIKITSTTNNAITSQNSQFTIADAPFITITAPAAGTELTDGKEYEIKWTDNIAENVDIELFKGGVKNSNIALNAPNTRSYFWNLPSSIIESNNYTIKITSTSNSSVVGQSGVFTIVDAKFITVTAPALNVNLFKAKEYEIKWTDNITENVNIELYKGGIKNRNIILNTPNDLSHLWTVSASLVADNDYSIRISSTTNVAVAGESGQFTISESVIDIDGNVYGTVTIGTQVWMTENMKTTRYNDGTAIANVLDDVAWATAGTTYAWYNNDVSTFKATYGALYSWYAVDPSSNGNRNICPSGWHVPTDAEWTKLTTFLGGETVAGGKMKEAGILHWTAPNIGADNSSGFTAVPGGDRGYSAYTFGNVGKDGSWWSNTAYDPNNAWLRNIAYDFTNAYRHFSHKQGGFSVRCLKD